MPKSKAGPGQLRPHSRSSSATRLGANLQFTQPTKKEHPTKAPPRPHSAQLQPNTLKWNPQPKATKGFTLASPSEPDDDDWVSSESGAGTPNQEESDSSDTASEADTASDVVPSQPEPTLARVQTARPSDFEAMTRIAPARNRPPSTHGKTDHSHTLRPHPLIRGISHGKPSPLAPLTVLPNPALSQASTTTPPSSLLDSARLHLSTSPASSLRTSSGSPVSADLPHSPYPFPIDRRTSFSSARSANTIPHSSTIRETAATWTHDRTRTLSSMSNSSSSAALSSLSHLPSVTRPPSPQTIAFFPPVNPHTNVEGIHPLLPVPYLHNHLTILSRRTPIRESFDRVIRAKNAR